MMLLESFKNGLIFACSPCNYSSYEVYDSLFKIKLDFYTSKNVHWITLKSPKCKNNNQMISLKWMFLHMYFF